MSNPLMVRFEPSPEASRRARLLALAGAAAWLVGAVVAPASTWSVVLLVSFFGVQLGLAGALFVAIQFLTGAGWSVALRRVPEALTALLPVAGAGVLLALICGQDLYPWASPEHPAHGGFKHFWLNRPFFLVRGVIYLALWTILSRAMLSVSRRQDTDPSLRHTVRLRVLSALFALAFGITYSLASFDWIMSREPEWFSTMFGVYQFASLFTAGLAVFILASLWLWRSGPFGQVLTESHRHDLGKLLFGMSCFWAYIWYCQYMLIWYTNIPEESFHFAIRQEGALYPFFYVHLVLSWLVPFVLLLPRAPKLSLKVLANVSCIVLLGHLLGLYLSILPPIQEASGALCAVVLVVGAVSLYWIVFCRALGQANLVPVNDPYLVESLPAPHGAHAVAHTGH